MYVLEMKSAYSIAPANWAVYVYVFACIYMCMYIYIYI